MSIRSLVEINHDFAEAICASVQFDDEITVYPDKFRAALRALIAKQEEKG